MSAGQVKKAGGELRVAGATSFDVHAYRASATSGNAAAAAASLMNRRLSRLPMPSILGRGAALEQPLGVLVCSSTTTPEEVKP